MNRTSALLVSVLAAAALAGCGNGSNLEPAAPKATSTPTSVPSAADEAVPADDKRERYTSMWKEWLAGSERMAQNPQMTEVTPEAFEAAYGWDEDDLISVSEVGDTNICFVSRDGVTLAVQAEGDGRSSLMMSDGTECSYKEDDASVVYVVGVGGSDFEITKGKRLMDSVAGSPTNTDSTDKATS